MGFVIAGNEISIYPECIRKAPRPGVTYIDIEDVSEDAATSVMWSKTSENPLVEAFVQNLSSHQG